MGSSQFVNNWLIPHLSSYESQFSGALILDSLLNFDPFPTSQGVSKEFHLVSLCNRSQSFSRFHKAEKYRFKIPTSPQKSGENSGHIRGDLCRLGSVGSRV